jgi:hypothetical protein
MTIDLWHLESIAKSIARSDWLKSVKTSCASMSSVSYKRSGREGLDHESRDDLTQIHGSRLFNTESLTWELDLICFHASRIHSGKINHTPGDKAETFCFAKYFIVFLWHGNSDLCWISLRVPNMIDIKVSLLALEAPISQLV